MRSTALTAALSAALLAVPVVGWAGSGASPAIEVQGDGAVVARMLIDSPSTEVRQAIPSLSNDAENSSQVIDVRLVSEGACTGIFRTTRGLWSPLRMQTRLCPTHDGWRELLVQSEDYDAYDVQWSVTPTAAGGSAVSMTVRSKVNLAVPNFLVEKATINGVNDTFRVLLERLFGAKR